MKDINVMINEITENLMDVTGYEKALDIRSVLYMHLSGYQLSEACRTYLPEEWPFRKRSETGESSCS